jgi:hypothetical protein
MWLRNLKNGLHIIGKSLWIKRCFLKKVTSLFTTLWFWYRFLLTWDIK